jgi:membrane associated rhomboid family serine protease
MGIGHDLGLQLREWAQNDQLDLGTTQALTNRLMDALGGEQGLRAPLRDLASQPLTLRALRLRGAEQQAALQALQQELAETYSPAVLGELLDLLEAATGLQLPRVSRQTRGDAVPESPAKIHPGHSWEAELHALAPGLLSGTIGALVLAWGAHELDRWTFARLDWSSGAALAAVLVLFQLISLVPGLRPLKRLGLIDGPASGDPHRIWRWISAAWIHRIPAEALVNGVMLLILLGTSPLGAGKVVLRYCLTTLACLAPSLLMARLWGVNRRWGGASGAIAALTALAATLSLLQGRELAFAAGPLRIPAWVLLVVFGGIQLSWLLPRQGSDDTSRPLQRLWSSPWWWGSLAGCGWGLITRAGELLTPLLRARTGG